MPDAALPPIPGRADTAPSGPAQHGRFAGILEGAVATRPELERITAEINALGLAHADLEVDGGRFSLLLDEQTVPGNALSSECLSEFGRLLGELTRASADPASVESTLRCTTVHGDTVVETMFAPVRGEMRAVSRVRPAEADDRVRTSTALQPLGRRRVTLIGGLFALALAMFTWQSGLLDRVFSVDATQLEIDEGPFRGLLHAEAESSWGSYRVTLQPGADYPVTSAELRALLAKVETTAARAAILAVANGNVIFVRLLDDAGDVLTFAPVLLRGLIDNPEGDVVAMLPGRRVAHSIVLGLAAR